MSILSGIVLLLLLKCRGSEQIDCGLQQWQDRGKIHLQQLQCLLLYDRGEKLSLFQSSTPHKTKLLKFSKSLSGFTARKEKGHLSSEILNSNISSFFLYKKSGDPRDLDMEKGLSMAIKQGRAEGTNLSLVLLTKDRAELGITFKDSHCAIYQSNKAIARLHWPPVLAQNVKVTDDGILVLGPDFSYFSSFQGGHNHGDNDDVWFKAVNLSIGRRMSIQRFSSKLPGVVWRGTADRTVWGELRRAVINCHHNGVVDTVGGFLSRGQMSGYQGIVTLPGNGVWSWSTKFALLAVVVPLMIPADVLNGETWETRSAMELLPFVHYLPLPANLNEICGTLQNHSRFISANPMASFEIAKRSTLRAQEMLNQKKVVDDLFVLLKQYNKLGGGRDIIQ